MIGCFQTCYTTARGQYGLLACRAREEDEREIHAMPHICTISDLSRVLNKYSIEVCRACCLISHMPGLLLYSTLYAKRLDRTDTARQ